MSATRIVWMGLALSGCLTNLEYGHDYAGPTVGRSLTLNGFGPTQGGALEVEVLDPADQNPTDSAATWSLLTTTTASASATVHPDGTPLYEFSASVVPVPDPSFASRWREGGLTWLRIRDLASGVTIVPYDDLSCAQSHPGPLMDVLSDCGSPDHGGRGLLGWSTLALVDNVDPGHLDPAAIPGSFLDQEISLWPQANAYRAAVVDTSRSDLDAWLAVNGFPGDAARAIYYNAQDLGSGRSTHCRQVRANEPGEMCDGTTFDPVVRTACYVTNYGDIGNLDAAAVESALTEAVDGAAAHLEEPPDLVPVYGPVGIVSGPRVTVAMEHLAIAPDDTDVCTGAPPDPTLPIVNRVRFYAYDHATTPALATTGVTLTAFGGNQYLPGVCLNCHGGEVREIEAEGELITEVVDAHFLPFDLTYLEYSAEPDYTRADQEASFRELNRMVLETEPSHGTQIAQVLLDHYGVATPPLAGSFLDDPAPPDRVDLDADGIADDIDLDGVPDLGWSNEERLYDEVYRPYCRGCHAAQDGDHNFDTYEEFEGVAPRIGQLTCDIQSMPNARVTAERFRTGRARAVLVGELRDHGLLGPLDCPTVP